MTLKVLRSIDQIFSRTFLNLGMSDVFLMISLELCTFWEEGKMPGSQCHIKSRFYQPDSFVLMLTLIIFLRLCLSCFSTVKKRFIHLYTLVFGRSHYKQPTLTQGSIFLRKEYMHYLTIWKSVGYLSIFIYRINYLYHKGLIDIYLHFGL